MVLPLVVMSNKIIGETVLTTAIKHTCDDVISLLGHLGENYEHLEEDLEELDLENHIKIWNIYLEAHCAETEDKAILESIESMRNILDTIREELRDLRQEMENHSKKWFNEWRCDNSEKKMDRLRRHKKIFMERVNLFYNLHKI